MKCLLKVCIITLLMATGNTVIAYGDNYIYDGILYQFDFELGYFCVPAPQSQYLTRENTSIKIPNELEFQKNVFKPVRDIRVNAFSGCQYITEMVLPDTIWYLGSQAFANCVNLKTLTLPKTVKSIGSYCFTGCVKLKEVTLPEGAILPDGLFSGCVGLETVILPKIDANVETGRYIFRNCSRLANVTFPPTYKASIGPHMFQGCTGLKSISIPNSIKKISSYAFEGCTSLKSVILSSSIGILEECAFQNCTALKSVGFSNKQPLRIKPLVFDNCISLEEVTILYDRVYAIDSGAFRGCKNLKKITIPAGIKQGIGASVFEGCAALDTVTALIEQPYAFGRDAFKGISPTCVLMVPYGKRSAYIAAGWTEKVFKGGVKEIIPAGISQVKVKTKETGWYDLQGRKIAQPEKGHIYISGGKKVMK